MIRASPDLFKKHVSTGIVLDSNLLLLLFVGSYDRSLVGTHKRTREYAPEDYDLLSALVSRFRALVTTPNILTEVSNLAGYIADPARELLFGTMRIEIARLSENYLPSSSVVSDERFPRYGLTDTAIYRLAESDSLLVLTDDLKLAGFLHTAGVDAVNFNHIRTGSWQRS